MQTKRFKTLLILVLCTALAAHAQIGWSDRFAKNTVQLKALLPSSPVDFVTRKIIIDSVVFTNDHTSQVSVWMMDRSTDCAGQPCPITPSPITIKAKTVWPMPMFKIEATNGVQWYASVPNVVVGRIVGSY